MMLNFDDEWEYSMDFDTDLEWNITLEEFIDSIVQNAVVAVSADQNKNSLDTLENL